MKIVTTLKQLSAHANCVQYLYLYNDSTWSVLVCSVGNVRPAMTDAYKIDVTFVATCHTCYIVVVYQLRGRCHVTVLHSPTPALSGRQH